MKRISEKVKRIVVDRYNERCCHPFCGRRGYLEFHHIIPRSLAPELIDNEDNIILLCPTHHTFGNESAHLSNKWLRYYFKFLTPKLREEYKHITNKQDTLLLNKKKR